MLFLREYDVQLGVNGLMTSLETNRESVCLWKIPIRKLCGTALTKHGFSVLFQFSRDTHIYVYIYVYIYIYIQSDAYLIMYIYLLLIYIYIVLIFNVS